LIKNNIDPTIAEQSVALLIVILNYGISNMMVNILSTLRV